MGNSTGEKGQWWRVPLGWAWAAISAFLAIPLAMFVHEHLSQWAAPICWGLLICAALPSVGYFAQRITGWLTAPLSLFSIVLSVMIAAMEGWNSQIGIALDLARGGLFVGSVVVFVATTYLVWRRNRIVRSM